MNSMPPDRAAQITNSLQTSSDASQCAPLDVSRLERVVRHVIHRDLTQGKRGLKRKTAARALLSPHANADVELGEEGAGLDSLELISAATAVSRFFDLGATGMDDYLLFEETVGGWARLVAQHFETCGESALIVFETSGSTDSPTLVRKTLTELQAEVDALLLVAMANTPTRIVALPPPQHIFGWLFTVMLPARLDIPVLDASFRGPGSIMAQLTGGDLVIGTPFNWQTLLSANRNFRPGVAGVTSAGPMPRHLWDDLDDAGLAALTEVFGSTETGGIGWRCDGDAPFALLPHLSREGQTVITRIDGQPLPLQDELSWQGRDSFLPGGRIDRAVQIAGVNVSLEKVRAALCDIDLVADAAVRPEGARLKAFVVPSDPGASEDALAEALGARMRDKLDPVARPTSYTFGEALPRNSMGKLSDW